MVGITSFLSCAYDQRAYAAWARTITFHWGSLLPVEGIFAAQKAPYQTPPGEISIFQASLWPSRSPNAQDNKDTCPVRLMIDSDSLGSTDEGYPN
jgi:hypothetical protein